MKLELRHIAPYLPYELKLQYTHTEKIGVMRNLYDIEDYDTIKIAIEWGDGEHIWMFKPILRPLSDLTKEIEHNGEKVVPIEVIGSEFFPDLQKSEHDGEISFGWEEHYMDDSQGFEFNFCNENMIFGVWYDVKEDGEAPIYTVGGYKEINKLFEWHFDVYGLIPQGLAIDTNTLK